MFVRRLARPLLASFFLTEGLANIRTPEQHAAELDPFLNLVNKYVQIPADAKTVVNAVGVTQVAGGVLLASGKLPRVGALLLAVPLPVSTYVHEAFWSESDPAAKANKKSNFFRNLAIMGGVILAAVDTAGKPSLRYQAVEGARQSARAARRSAKTARREAKLLAAQTEVPFAS